MRNLPIRMKVVVWCGLALLAALVCGFSFAGYNIWQATEEKAEQEAMKIVAVSSTQIKGRMDGLVKIAESLGASLTTHGSEPKNDFNEVQKLVLKQIEGTQDAFSAFAWVQNGKILPETLPASEEKHDPAKYTKIVKLRLNGAINGTPVANCVAKASDDWFWSAFNNQKPHITEPYFWDYGDGKQRLISSLVAPVTRDGGSVGVVGMDISMNQMQEIADDCEEFSGKAVLGILSPTGTIMGFKGKPDYVGKDLVEYSESYKAVKDRVLAGETLSVWATNGDLVIYYPFEIGETSQYIVSCMRIPEHVIVAPAKAALYKIIGLGTLCLVIAAAVMWVVAGKIAKPIVEVVSRLDDISDGEGDLTVQLEVLSKDEVGQLATAFNKFVSKIHDTIAEVAAVTLDVASASTQIAASSEEIAAGMEEQSSQVQEISTAVEEMSASVTEVAKKSHEANDNAGQAKSTALEGGEIVNETMTGMSEIEEVVKDSGASIGELGKQGERIGEIIEVINDIADQTNLLALNAAIEAARAGEHGRGFAVVADEVRKLADRTTKATDGVSELIGGIQSGTQVAVDKMSSGTEIVGRGVESAQRAGESLNQIVNGAEHVAEMIQSIAAASEQQSAAAEQISKNIQSIAAVTNQSKEGTMQASQAAAGLSEKAEALKALVGQFKTREINAAA